MTVSSQDKVLEIIAGNTQNKNFISFPQINITEVKTSTLGLFNDVISKNIGLLLDMQEHILKEILTREKEYDTKYNVREGIVKSIKEVLKETNEKLREIDVNDVTKRLRIRAESNCKIDLIVNQRYKKYLEQ